jgi:mRNA interferase YafQ
MLELIATKSFKKDIKKIGKSINPKLKSLINEVILTIQNEKPLEERFHNHLLKGGLKGFFDCHILPDLVLIYEIDKINNELILKRIGSHSDLFKN